MVTEKADLQGFSGNILRFIQGSLKFSRASRDFPGIFINFIKNLSSQWLKMTWNRFKIMGYFTMVEEKFEIHHLKWPKMTWNRSKIMGYFTMVEENFEIHHLKWLKMTWNRFKIIGYVSMVEENFEINHLIWRKMTWNRFKIMGYFTMVEENSEIYHLKWLKIDRWFSVYIKTTLKVRFTHGK